MTHAVVERKISFPVGAVFWSAVQEGDNVELCRVLRTSGHHVQLDETNHAGLTALHVSVLNANLDAVKMLLACGANPNISDENGFTPLHTASATGHIHTAVMLLLHQAQVFALTRDGDLPVDLAKDYRMSDLLCKEMIRCAHRECFLRASMLFYSRILFGLLCEFLRKSLQLTARVFATIYNQLKSRNTWATRDLKKTD